MEPIQIALFISLIAVTAIFVASGIWLILLFKDLRQLLQKTSAILDDTHLITSSVAKPVSSVSEFLMGFKNGFKVFNRFFNQESD